MSCSGESNGKCDTVSLILYEFVKLSTKSAFLSCFGSYLTDLLCKSPDTFFP